MLIVVIYIIPEGRAAGSFQFLNLHHYMGITGIGMTGKLALPTLIALSSITLCRPTLGSLVVLGEISISGILIKVDELANSLQVC